MMWSILVWLAMEIVNLAEFDGSLEISGLKISDVVDLKVVGESWKNKQESQRRPVEVDQESSDG